MSKIAKRFFLASCLLAIALAVVAASRTLPARPVTLTIWHNFSGDRQIAMDALIDEFNGTVGKERGIIMNVTAITSSAELEETLRMIAAGDPGAPKMPDIAAAYPRTALLFQSRGLLANLDDYFTAEELAAYVPAFIEEGRFGDGGLYVFPFAKSTETLFLNRTLFDRFAAECGVSMDCFETFEGIAEAATRYYAWTNAQTPDMPGDGRQFFTADSWLNLAQAGMLQMGERFFAEETLNLESEAYAHIWETCYAPTVAGGFALYDGYASNLSKTGELVCSTGSSAGILFYGDAVVYPDNTTERVEYDILPFPVFAGGRKMALQRGSGFCVAASEKERERAAAAFLKWFTAPERNVRLVASTGYMPVTKRAFTEEMPKRLETERDPLGRKMLATVIRMHAEYDFFVPPVSERFDGLARGYEKDYRATLARCRAARLTEAATLADTGAAALRDFIGAKRDDRR